MPTPAPKRKVLIVDDEAAVRTMMQRYISLSGYEVIQAANAAEGLKILESTPPDLILLDISLPDIDGLSVLRTLHEKYEKLPVIMLAGPTDIPKAHTALNCGASDFLAKPIDHAALKRTLQIHLR
jgi:DNA-binding response OmpR family regulator